LRGGPTTSASLIGPWASLAVCIHAIEISLIIELILANTAIRRITYAMSDTEIISTVTCHINPRTGDVVAALVEERALVFESY
jgi:hypothetical protein